MDSIPEAIPRECEGCSKTFTPDKYEEQRNPQKYCSQECYHEHSEHFLGKMTDEERKEFFTKRSAVRRANYATQKQQHFAERQCGNCGKTFWVNKYRAEHFHVSYCSAVCRNAKRSETHFSKVKSPEEVRRIYQQCGKKRRAHYHPEGIPRSPETILKIREIALARGSVARDTSYMKTEEFKHKKLLGYVRHATDIVNVAEHYANLGYKTLIIHGKFRKPDIILRKDDRLIAVEVEEGKQWPDSMKYNDLGIFDEAIWVAPNDRSERKLKLAGLQPIRLSLPSPPTPAQNEHVNASVSNL